MLALIAGQGALPGMVAKARPDAVLCELEGYPAGLGAARRFRVERLGSFMADLKAAGVTEVCLAGRVGRPRLDPSLVDAATMPLVPRMMAALQVGDDAALRTVLGFFEEAGFTVRAAPSRARRPSATWPARCRRTGRWGRPTSGRRSSWRKGR